MSLQTFISRVQVKNYRSIADINIKLGPLTVLVGPNGSGKSNLIDALRFTRDFVNIGLETAIISRDGIDFIQIWQPDNQYNEVQIKIYLENTNWQGEYSFILETEKLELYNTKQEHIYIREKPHNNTHTSFEVELEDHKTY